MEMGWTLNFEASYFSKFPSGISIHCNGAKLLNS